MKTFKIFKSIEVATKDFFIIVTALGALGLIWGKFSVLHNNYLRSKKTVEVTTGMIRDSQAMIGVSTLEHADDTKVIIKQTRNKLHGKYYAYIEDGVNEPYEALYNYDLKQFYYYDFKGKIWYVKRVDGLSPRDESQFSNATYVIDSLRTSICSDN